jgi:predicted alpha/beta-hydrolase family hydrolase
MLAADEPGLVEGLLLLSYPLHPPRRPAELRTAHFPNIRTRAMFVHGTRDPFGSPQEMKAALAMVAAPAHLRLIEGAGHDLTALRSAPAAAAAVNAFLEFAAG